MVLAIRLKGRMSCFFSKTLIVILCLSRKLTVELPEWKGEYVASYGASNARGCAILMKRNIADGRLCYVDIDINGQKIRLVCVYAPNHPTGRQRLRSDELSASLSQTSKNIVAGDFNCVHSFASDTKNGSAQSEVGSSELEEMCTTFGLHDSWRVNNPQAVRFSTWRRQGNDANQASRIDRIYFPWDIPIVYDYLSCPYSDHDCVCASLDLAPLASDKTPVTGKSYWKLNCSILSENGFAVC